jgi:hypothetical protein
MKRTRKSRAGRADVKQYNAGYYQTHKPENVAKCQSHRDRFPEYYMIYDARRRDRKRGLSCDLTREYVLSIWPSDGKCPYCLETMVPKTKKAPSLDEVIYGFGHVMGNVAIVCHLCNRRKADRTLEWFERIAARIRECAIVRLRRVMEARMAA